MGEMFCRRFSVSGRVQGVFFRTSAARYARALGLTGRAINLEDGRVEVIACGTEDAVDALGEWLHVGPPEAEVTEVVSEAWAGKPPKDFRTG